VKRFTLAVLVFTVLLVGYWAWPFVELRAVAAALQAHSAAALSECWFTEGFDTLDLKEAKALLDELGT
jgi:hypothetical protein